jgi:uncharacterized membrane protein
MNDLLTGIIYLSFCVGAIGAALALIGISFFEKTPVLGVLIAVIGLGVMGAGGIGGVNAMSGSIEISKAVQALSQSDASATNK